MIKMLSEFIVAGLTITIVNIFKEQFPNMKKSILPLPVFIIAGALNTANAVVFSGGEVDAIQGLSQGLVIGALSSGIYSMGKSALKKGEYSENDYKSDEVKTE
jgi:hypothetical protein